MGLREREQQDSTECFQAMRQMPCQWQQLVLDTGSRPCASGVIAGLLPHLFCWCSSSPQAPYAHNRPFNENTLLLSGTALAGTASPLRIAWPTVSHPHLLILAVQPVSSFCGPPEKPSCAARFCKPGQWEPLAPGAAA